MEHKIWTTVSSEHHGFLRAKRGGAFMPIISEDLSPFCTHQSSEATQHHIAVVFERSSIHFVLTFYRKTDYSNGICLHGFLYQYFSLLLILHVGVTASVLQNESLPSICSSRLTVGLQCLYSCVHPLLFAARGRLCRMWWQDGVAIIMSSIWLNGDRRRCRRLQATSWCVYPELLTGREVRHWRWPTAATTH